MPILLSATTCFGQSKESKLKQQSVQRELLKEYFLCACITEGFKDKRIEENDISQAVYFDILRYSPDAFQEVKGYVKRFIDTIRPSPIKDLGSKKAIILNCIEKYKDKSLNKFIMSMDKYMLDN